VLDPWPFPTGRRRPSLRIGVPWFAGFCAWTSAGWLAVDLPVLRRPGPVAWVLWISIAAVALPVAVAIASLIVDVAPDLRAMALAAVPSAAAAVVALLVLFPEFPAFAFVGGFFVPLVTVAAYAFATAHGEEARRDAKGR
jgi:hypothetical protein